MKLENVIKISQTQKDTADNTGSIGTHVISPDNLYLEGEGEWSSWTTITSSTTIQFKGNAYYHFQVKPISEAYIQDYGIVRMSSDRQFIIAGFGFGSTGTRLTFYRVASNVYATYVYQQTGSSFSSLSASSGTYYVRYKRVNL